MIRIFAIYYFLLMSVVAFGANKSEGETYFANKQFDKAKLYYEAQLKKNPKDPFSHYMIGRSCYELKDTENAILHLEQATSKFSHRDFILGELYFQTYRFEEAVKAYQSCLEHISPNDSRMNEVQNGLKKAEIGARMMTKVDDIALIDSVIVDKSDFLNFYRYGIELGSLTQEQVKVVGQQTDKIQYTTQRKDRIYFSDSIHGQMDLFSSFRLMDDWSLPDSLPRNINTSANENYPFLLLDGITLYFASDGENSLGGYDLFVTRYSPVTKTFLTPENLGMPFNSPSNDYMMVIDEQQKMGWFASDRNLPSNKVMIYTFETNDTKRVISTDDKTYIRKLAQLASYRKVARTTSDSVMNDSSAVIYEDLTKKINIIINDTLVYQYVNEFKSFEAKKMCIEYNRLSLDLSNKKLQLDELRQIYGNLDTSAEKKLFTQKIMDLEKKNNEAGKVLQAKLINIRNFENKSLQKAKIRSN